MKEQRLIHITHRRDGDRNQSNLYTLQLAHSPSDRPSDSPSDRPSDRPYVQPVTVNRTVKENRKEKESGAKKAKEVEIEFPESLDTKNFKDQWAAYEEYRQENKLRRLKPSSIKAKLAELSEWGEEVAIEQIRQTIGNGWQGIFPPKSFSSMPRTAGAPEAKESSAPRRPTWEIKQVLDVVEDDLRELRLHRSEVAGGSYHWDAPHHRQAYIEKLKQRKQLKKEMTSSC